MRNFLHLLFALPALASLAVLGACQFQNSIPKQLGASASYEVVASFPHDPTAYTQGLLIHKGIFYESTGTYGHSNLRKVDPETGNILQNVALDEIFFGEGLALLNNRLYQLTWKEKTGFIYDVDTLELVGSWKYDNAGWGLTTDGTHLIMSDGSSALRWIDPLTFEVVRTLEVTQDDVPANNLNELEWIEGEIYANVYMTEHILRINTETGNVMTVLDLTGLMPKANQADPSEVLNGIAYDPETQRLFVTGKRWDVLYEIRLVSSPTTTTKQP